MRKLVLLTASLCAMALVAAANPAQAQFNRSYVSNTGSDSHGCSNPTTDACATFQYALSQTVPYGEIDCVNAGNYGGVTGLTIAQSVTIDCANGVGLSIQHIIVNGNGIAVRLRNLTINGSGSFGIDAENMAALYIEDCVISNATSGSAFGIVFEPTASALLFVTDSVVSNNGNTGVSGGIDIVPASGVTANVAVNNSRIKGNVFGVVADGRQGGTVKGTVTHSVISGNAQDGIAALSSGSSVWLLVNQTEASGNAYGLAAGGSGAEILVRNSSVFGNTTGLHSANGGTLYSYNNNSLNGNTTNGAFTGTIGLQ